MNTLRTRIYEGRTLTQGETLLVTHTESFDPIPACIIVLKKDLTAKDIEKAHRLGDLNNMHFARVLEDQGLVTCHQINELVFDRSAMSIDLEERQDRTSL